MSSPDGDTTLDNLIEGCSDPAIAAALRAAIEGLYEAFAGYPARPDMPACSHCVTPEDVERITSKPLRELTSQDLDLYAFDAMCTWGETADLKCFLPRLFEILAAAWGAFFHPDFLLSKLDDAEWLSWPPAERDAVERYLDALWRTALQNDIDASSLMLLIDGLTRSGWDVGRLVAAWRDAAEPGRTGHLIGALYEYSEYMPFTGEEADYAPIRRWLLSDAAEALLRRRAGEGDALGDVVYPRVALRLIVAERRHSAPPTPSALAEGVDITWFERHLLDDILPRWLVAVDDDGFFHPRLTRQWERTGEPVATLVSQGRLCYNFAVGYELTGRPDYREALARGAQYLATRFRDPDYPGWVFAIHQDGTIVDRSKYTYGHAFLLFGLSHAARALGDAGLLEPAEAVFRFIHDRLGGRRGDCFIGVNDAVTELLAPERRSINPVMHLFEALVAYSDVKPGTLYSGPAVKADAKAWRAFWDLLRAGNGTGTFCLPEEYTADWLPPAEGAWVNVGHQFEWAYLLSRRAETMPRPSTCFLAMADGLLDYGLAEGFDATDGGVCTRVALDGPTPPEWRKERGWWEQAEASRAMMHFAFVRGRHDLIEPLKRNIEFVKTHLVDHEYGGWFPRPGATEALKGSEWKVDYHVVGLCAEAIRLARMADEEGPRV